MALWWTHARGNAACVTSSCTQTSFCVPDSNMQAEGECSERKHWGLCGNVVFKRLAPTYFLYVFSFFCNSNGHYTMFCPHLCLSRKQDQYRFCWYLPLAGLKLRWVAEQERSPDTHLRLHTIRTKMYHLREQLQQQKTVRLCGRDTNTEEFDLPFK